MQTVPITKLNPHPDNSYYFDDITGESWDNFLRSIKTSGVKVEILVTQDMTIVSGHQRIRACKELGINEVRVHVTHYDDEDSILKDMIEINVMQRGIGNINPVKMGRCIKTLERIYGIQHGGDRSRANNYLLDTKPRTEQEFADKLGISLPSLKNYKKLAELIPEVQDFLATGMINPTTALALARQLSSDDQIRLLSQLDAAKKYTKDEIQRAINDMKQQADTLAAENRRLKDENRRLSVKDDEAKLLSLAEENKALRDEVSKQKIEIETYRKQVYPNWDNAKQGDVLFDICRKCIDFQNQVLSPIENGDAIYATDGSDVLHNRVEKTLLSLIDSAQRIIKRMNTVEVIDIRME